MECWCGRYVSPEGRAHSAWFHGRLREILQRRLAERGLRLSDDLSDREFIMAALPLTDHRPAARGEESQQGYAMRAAATGGAVARHRCAGTPDS